MARYRVTVFSALTDTIMLGNPQKMSGGNGTITRVVIHGTVSPCERGGARNVARYFQGSTAGGLAHYVVDPSEIVGCCSEDVKCAHAPPNVGSIGIELCDPQAGDPARWGDDDHRSMLALAASLAADLCARYSLPTVWLSSADLAAVASGITGHVQVAEAFHQSDHTDPRDMPVDVFMALVTGGDTVTQEQMDQLIKEIRENAVAVASDVKSTKVDVETVAKKLDQLAAQVDKLKGDGSGTSGDVTVSGTLHLG